MAYRSQDWMTQLYSLNVLWQQRRKVLSSQLALSRFVGYFLDYKWMGDLLLDLWFMCGLDPSWTTSSPKNNQQTCLKPIEPPRRQSSRASSTAACSDSWGSRCRQLPLWSAFFFQCTNIPKLLYLWNKTGNSGKPWATTLNTKTH